MNEPNAGRAGAGAQQLRLRRATAADSEFAFQTKRNTLRAYIDQVWGWDEEEQRRMHENRFAARDYQVIELLGDRVGILVAERLADRVAVHQLFVLPEHQGRGVGTWCMRRIMAGAAMERLPVRLNVLKVNTRVLEFYRGLGFQRFGETDTHIQLERRPDAPSE